MSGWISLHRSLKDHFLFDFNEPDKALAWIDLLLSASHRDHTVKIKGRPFLVLRGQCCVSQVTLQQRWKMSQNKVKRFLNLLKNEGMIDVQTNDLTTIITICNYSVYQDDERADERTDERADERPVERSVERQSIMEQWNNKDISSNEEIISAPKKKSPPSPKKTPTELDYSCWPSMPSSQTLTDWLAMRKRLKADATQTVINRFATELNKAVAAGFTVDQCIAECCARNWKGFQLAWLHNAGVNPYGYQTSNNQSSVERYENPTARILRLARECEPAEHPGVIEAEFKAH